MTERRETRDESIFVFEFTHYALRITHYALRITYYVLRFSFVERIKDMPVILAIESSCDETSASVCVDGKILSNIIANQSIHEQYGGVVPELASRAHMQNIVPTVDAALKKANITVNEIDAVGFTQAPGLIGSLLVGAQFAKSLALRWKYSADSSASHAGTRAGKSYQ